MTVATMPVPILIVDDRRDVLDLNRILLEAEGYEADGYAYNELTEDVLHKLKPQVILLDLESQHDDALDLLHRLHGDPATKETNVVITSASAALVDRLMRDPDLHIAAGLVMPFDIEALYAAIAAAAEKRPSERAELKLAGPSSQLLGALEDLQKQRSRVLIRWLQRLSTLASFRNAPELSLAELRGQGDTLFDGIASGLRASAAVAAFAPGGTTPMATVAGASASPLIEAARKHGQLRRLQGVHPGDLTRELDALRHEIWQELYTNSDSTTALPSEDIWDLASRLNTTLEDVTCACIEGWNKDGGK